MDWYCILLQEFAGIWPSKSYRLWEAKDRVYIGLHPCYSHRICENQEVHLTPLYWKSDSKWPDALHLRECAKPQNILYEWHWVCCVVVRKPAIQHGWKPMICANQIIFVMSITGRQKVLPVENLIRRCTFDWDLGHDSSELRWCTGFQERQKGRRSTSRISWAKRQIWSRDAFHM